MSNELKELIAIAFYNGNHETPRAENVGELIDQLKRLPPELPLSGWPEKYSHEIVVYNVSEHNPHLTIEEIDI